MRQIWSQRWECPSPQIGPPQHLCVQLYFGQVFIIFPALAPADGMFLRSSGRHYSANGGGSIYNRLRLQKCCKKIRKCRHFASYLLKNTHENVIILYLKQKQTIFLFFSNRLRRFRPRLWKIIHPAPYKLAFFPSSRRACGHFEGFCEFPRESKLPQGGRLWSREQVSPIAFRRECQLIVNNGNPSH